jgi:protease-4
LQLRKHKPVVASIGARGASGGYYIAAMADYIYALPNSEVGSIGVIGSLPTPVELDENVITSGPFKATGGSRRKATAEMETLKRQFVNSVMLYRGDRLNISEVELSRAEVYTGTESLRYGLVDEIGTSTAAIGKAASLAGIRNFQIDKRAISQLPVVILESSVVEKLRSNTNLMPIYYYLYIESE